MPTAERRAVLLERLAETVDETPAAQCTASYRAGYEACGSAVAEALRAFARDDDFEALLAAVRTLAGPYAKRPQDHADFAAGFESHGRWLANALAIYDQTAPR